MGGTNHGCFLRFDLGGTPRITQVKTAVLQASHTPTPKSNPNCATGEPLAPNPGLAATEHLTSILGSEGKPQPQPHPRPNRAVQASAFMRIGGSGIDGGLLGAPLATAKLHREYLTKVSTSK